MRSILYISLVAIICLSVGDIGQNSSSTYRSFVDGYHGFYKVAVAETEDVLPYENYTLNINVGEEIVWINDDQSDTLTIISEQESWKGDEAVLESKGGKFSHIFNNSGTFTVYIKQYRDHPKQTIIVSGTDIPVPAHTDTPVPTYTDTPVPAHTDTPVPTYTVGKVSISTNQILMPLNILRNIKMTIIITFVIVILYFLVKI